MLPSNVSELLWSHECLDDLIEVVLDLGRLPVARFVSSVQTLSEKSISRSCLDSIVAELDFGPDNRAGIEGTLHRISGIRNRCNDVIGITCRVGRPLVSSSMIRDLLHGMFHHCLCVSFCIPLVAAYTVNDGAPSTVHVVLRADPSSILILGRPGIGKTTVIRDISRTLADEMHRRVVIVDTSNEIGGDGDIPHPAIGSARRMQVPRERSQADVMVRRSLSPLPISARSRQPSARGQHPCHR